MAITPTYSWPLPDDTSLVKDGAEAIRDLGNAIDTTVSGLGSGLVHIETQTFSATSGVSFNDVFTSDYKDYFIKFVGSGSTTDGGCSLRLRASGSDNTAAVYNQQQHVISGTSPSGNVVTSQTSFPFTIANRRNFQLQLNVFRPQTNTPTNIIGHMVQTQLGGGAPYSAANSAFVNGSHDDNFQADGFTLIFSVNFDGYAMVYGYED